MRQFSFFVLVILVLCENLIPAQSLKQTIRGKVTDTDSKSPLIGVTLFIESSNPIIGTTSDAEGCFTFPKLPIGRYNVAVTYVGYEQKIIPNLLLNAGKELYINIELTETVKKLDEIVVKARKNKGEPLNEMATVSARSVTVEETQRFAGSFNDPSRMVSSFAGIMGDPDGNNDIIIRGNSPRGLLWRIEGVDVPNPNHFANEGATGGPISILNSATLDNSDFMTGAFPAEYGNAYSGVFDIHMRKGNDQKREFIAQIGIIGTDLTAEGPFIKNSSASYLINYRYSSLALLNQLGVKVAGNAIPKFQDMTLNVYVPTKKCGTFQVFGIGGLSNIYFSESDYTNDFAADMGVIGLNHVYPLSEKTYIRTSLSFSGTRNIWEYHELEEEPDTWVLKGHDRFYYETYTGDIDITHKFSARNTIKIGTSFSSLGYNLFMDDYDWDNKVLYNALNDKGSSGLVQSFINWKYKPLESVTINSGVQFKYFNLNGHYAFEPRIGARWQFTPRQALTAGFGMHSKVDNISLYLLKEHMDDGTLIQNNKDLGFLKARHYVLGYENRISLNLNLKAEVYYQELYDVPVEGYAESSSYSIINETNGYIITKLQNEGTGKNYGLELSLEKFFSKNYYFLVTGSLFDSKYKGSDGIERNSRFNNNYIANMVAGKEFIVGKKKNSAIDINLRGTYAGGQRYTPINVEQSIAQEQEVRFDDEAFSKQRPTFVRFDFKLSYRRNKKKTTRVWELDIENVTNTLNVTGDYWDYKKEEVVEYTQLGLLPNISYRIEF